jgi:hypothetical protein
MENCAICLESVQTLKACRLPCKHCFHESCLLELVLTGSSICCVCRAPFFHCNHTPNTPYILSPRTWIQCHSMDAVQSTLESICIKNQDQSKAMTIMREDIGLLIDRYQKSNEIHENIRALNIGLLSENEELQVSLHHAQDFLLIANSKLQMMEKFVMEKLNVCILSEISKSLERCP